MENYKKLREEAIRLRKLGLSYKEIKGHIAVSKSTLSYWLKFVALKPEHKKRLYTKKILILARGPQSQRERRKREVEKIIKEAGEEIKTPISSETFKLFGAALYWAEGSKTQQFSVTNSDPHLILFMTKWFQKTFQVTPEQMVAKLNIYPQQNDREIKKFWSGLTGIPLKNFNKSFVKPPNKGYKKNNLYYGTIRIKLLKGTDMRIQTFGWVKKILSDLDSHVQIAQKRWISLTKTPRPINLQK